MRKQLLTIGQLALNDLPGLRRAVLALGRQYGGDWRKYGRKFVRFLDTLQPSFSVFREGNGKLPFYHFVTLPIITCPGYGACAAWCYSFRAWRHPQAFFRQLGNTVLMRHHRRIVTQAFSVLPADIILRLYVDGDFDSLRTLKFWMKLLRTRPDIAAYGYSKSWDIFLEYDKHNGWPTNYMLNISGGSRYGKDKEQAMLALECTRDRFEAFKVSTRLKANPTQHRRELRQAAKEAGFDRAFICPGKCGGCANGKHACGSSKFNGVPIIIGIH